MTSDKPEIPEAFEGVAVRDVCGLPYDAADYDRFQREIFARESALAAIVAPNIPKCEVCGGGGELADPRRCCEGCDGLGFDIGHLCLETATQLIAAGTHYAFDCDEDRDGEYCECHRNIALLAQGVRRVPLPPRRLLAYREMRRAF